MNIHKIMNILLIFHLWMGDHVTCKAVFTFACALPSWRVRSAAATMLCSAFIPQYQGPSPSAAAEGGTLCPLSSCGIMRNSWFWALWVNAVSVHHSSIHTVAPSHWPSPARVTPLTHSRWPSLAWVAPLSPHDLCIQLWEVFPSPSAPSPFGQQDS